MLLSSLREQRYKVFQGISAKNDPQWGFRRPVTAGVVVDETSAYGLSAFYACIRAIAEPLAIIPMKTYQRDGRGKREARDHRVWTLTHDQANPMMSALTFREAILQHAVGGGNGYGWIEYDKAFRPKALWLLRPDRTRVEKVDYRALYHVTNDKGHTETFEDWEILHIPGMGYDGVRGYSPIEIMQEVLGKAIAQDRFSGAFYGNGTVPGGVLEHPGKLSDDAYKRLKASHEENRQGPMNAHKTQILEEGMKWTQNTVKPTDAQALETLQYSAVEVARFMRMPASEIDAAGGKDSLTYSTLEQDARRYLMRSLLPWGRRAEAEYNRKLFSGQQASQFYVEHVYAALDAADTKSRYEAHRVASGGKGWKTQNEIRESENMNPIDGGDELPQTIAKDEPKPGGDPPADETPKKRALDALRGIFVDAAVRCLRRETKALSAANPRFGRDGVRGVEAWAEPFYQGHRDYLIAAFRPAVRALAAILDVEVDDASTAEAIAAAEIDRSRAFLAAWAADGMRTAAIPADGEAMGQAAFAQALSRIQKEAA